MTDMRRLTPGPSLADRVSELVREDIAGGNYKIGDGLKAETELAKSFGVSRTVMREAVARLKSEGLLESRQGSGIYVIATTPKASFQIEAPQEIELDKAIEVLEFREGFDAAAVSLAARRATKADVAGMRKALDAMDKAVGQCDVRGGTVADFEFHMLICEATKNPLYPQLFETFRRFLLDGLYVARGNSANRLNDSRPAQVEHGMILEAIAARDAAAARKAALIHIENTRIRLETAMRNNAEAGRLGKIGLDAGSE